MQQQEGKETTYAGSGRAKPPRSDKGKGLTLAGLRLVCCSTRLGITCPWSKRYCFAGATTGKRDVTARRTVCSKGRSVIFHTHFTRRASRSYPRSQGRNPRERNPCSAQLPVISASRPCYRCIAMASSVGIRRMFWTNANGQWEGGKVRDLVEALELAGASDAHSGSEWGGTAHDGAFVTKHEVLMRRRMLRASPEDAEGIEWGEAWPSGCTGS